MRKQVITKHELRRSLQVGDGIPSRSRLKKLTDFFGEYGRKEPRKPLICCSRGLTDYQYLSSLNPHIAMVSCTSDLLQGHIGNYSGLYMVHLAERQSCFPLARLAQRVKNAIDSYRTEGLSCHSWQVRIPTLYVRGRTF